MMYMHQKKSTSLDLDRFVFEPVLIHIGTHRIWSAHAHTDTPTSACSSRFPIHARANKSMFMYVWFALEFIRHSNVGINGHTLLHGHSKRTTARLCEIQYTTDFYYTISGILCNLCVIHIRFCDQLIIFILQSVIRHLYSFALFFFMNFCLSCPTHFFLITFLLVLLLLLFRLNFFSCCSMENDYDSICLKQYTKKKAIHRAFCCCFVSIQWNVNCVGHIDQCDNQLDLIFSHSHCAQRSSRHIQQANKKKSNNKEADWKSRQSHSLVDIVDLAYFVSFWVFCVSYDFFVCGQNRSV